MSPDTLTTVQQLLAKALGAPAQEFRSDRALSEIGIDSLGVMDVMFQLEDVYSIRIPEEKVPLETVGDVVQLIDRLRREAPGKPG